MKYTIKNILSLSIAATLLLVAIAPSLLSAQMTEPTNLKVIPLTWLDKEKIYETLFEVDVTYPEDLDKMLFDTDDEIEDIDIYPGSAQDGAFTADVLYYTAIDVESVLPLLDPDQQNYVLEHNLTGGFVRGDFTSSLATVTSVLGLAFSQDDNEIREHNLWIIGFVPVQTVIPEEYWDQFYHEPMRGGNKPPLFKCPPGYKLKSAKCYNDIVQECNDWIALEVKWANAQIDLAGQDLEDDLNDIGESELTCNMWIGLAMGPYGLILDGLTLVAIGGAIAEYNSKVDDIKQEMEDNIEEINEYFAAEGIKECCIKAPPLSGVHADGSVTLIFKLKNNGDGGRDGSYFKAVSSVLSLSELNARFAFEQSRSLNHTDNGILVSLDNNRKLLAEESSTEIDLGQSVTKAFSVNSSTQLYVAVAWFDKEAGCCSRITNNINVILSAPNGVYYHGNVFAEEVSSPNPLTWDNKSTEECFIIDNPTAGEWQLTIIGQDLPHGPQDFAYAVTGDIDKLSSAAGNQTPTFVIDNISLNSITNSKISFKITLSYPTHVEVQIFDLSGRKMGTILNSTLPAGENVVEHNSNLPNGIYFINVKADKVSKVHKILIVR